MSQKVRILSWVLPCMVLAACSGGGSAGSDSDAQSLASPAGPVTVRSSAGKMSAPRSVAQPTSAPSSYEYPAGFMAVDISELNPGQSVTLTIELPAGVSVNTFVKCLSDSQCAEFDGAVVNGNQVLLTLVDGGAGDADGLANGVIRDPGAPARAPAVVDTDQDGVADGDDNCPSVANADQKDLDQDGEGDLCDEDRDGDQQANDTDNCPELANADQADQDSDGLGDACDSNSDTDGDGIDDGADNCPDTHNADQADTDNDGAGDACDLLTDRDADGVADDQDNCPDLANADQADADNDGTGDACDDSGDPSPDPAVLAFFEAQVQPNLRDCRICHVPGGVADTDAGRGFLLSQDTDEDYSRLRSAWDGLGRGVASNRLLTKASNTDPEPHSGGVQWSASSQAYADARTLLSCWDDPENCELTSSGEVVERQALLGSRRGGHYWFDYCDGQPDSTPVPADPRSLVVAGTNDGLAVAMNVEWQHCQAGDVPANCGELRARAERGYPLVAADGEVGAGHMFAGNSSSSGFAFEARQFREMWQTIWRLPARPDNFDQLVGERWGMPLSQTHNPYPLAGEDPNLTNGGSGQLPIGLTQLRNPDGSWTGRLNATCSICHGGEVGEPADGPGLGPVYGTNSMSDITVMFTDLGQLAPQQSALAFISQNKVRGTGNITNFQLFGTLTLSDYNTWPGYLSIQAEPSTGTEDPPVWWNLGSRPAKFFDAGMVSGAKRIELSFHLPGGPGSGQAGKDWILAHQNDSDAWLLSLKAPPWPEQRLGAIDVALAEQGAVLFHAKNLWAPELNNPVPQPTEGNGSCAGCHGAYSPRYVHDPAYLEDPVLEGIAAYVTPIDIIGTDSRRLDGNSERVQQYARENWFAYSDGEKNEAGVALCGDWNDPDLRGERELGYLAPPLYGVWATAPYFHNGSVPSVWQVLKPEDRPDIWRRKSKPARADQAGQVVMGYSASLDDYDAQQLGWAHEELACGTGSYPLVDCHPTEAAQVATVQDGLSMIWANGGLAWNLLNAPILSREQIEERKIYNTHYYSQGNTGHEFATVLSDAERRAVIEYLKTL